MAGEINVEKLIIEKPEAAALPKAEKSSSPESKVERTDAVPEKRPEPVRPLETVGKNNTGKSGNVAPVSQTPNWQRQRAAEIDNILEEGLNEVFLQMKPVQQAAFKKAGEETVTKINKLLSETKVKIDKIIVLIRRWLRMIPGVNKFFLEQETKIKADKIMKIKNKF